MNPKIKYDSQILNDRMENMFARMENVVRYGMYSNQVVSDIYTRFQEFFTSFGKPSLLVREVSEGMPPWGDDINAMAREAAMDVNTLFKEATTLVSSAQAIFDITAAETGATQGLIDGLDKLLENFKVYTEVHEEDVEDVYVGDTFDDEQYIESKTCRLDLNNGLISLPITGSVNYSPKATVNVHGGTETSYPGNFLQGVETRVTAGFTPTNTKANDITASADAGQTLTGDGGTLVEKSSVTPAAEIYGTTHEPSAVIDGNPETMYEYEMVIVPNHTFAKPDPEMYPILNWPRWSNLIWEELIPKIREKDPLRARRHPMMIAKSATDASSVNPIGIFGDNPNIPVNDVRAEGWSYTMNKDWYYKAGERIVPRVKFVTRDWSPIGSADNLEVNIEFEFPEAVPVTSVTITPAILQDISQDFVGADHFTLSDVGFVTIPNVGEPGIQETKWASDIGIEMPIQLYGPKTLTFPLQQVHSIILYLTCDAPYRCKCAHPYLESDIHINVTMQKKKGGSFGFGKIRTVNADIWFGDRYQLCEPDIGEVFNYQGFYPDDEARAKEIGISLDPSMAGAAAGAYITAVTVGGLLAGPLGWIVGFLLGDVISDFFNTVIGAIASWFGIKKEAITNLTITEQKQSWGFEGFDAWRYWVAIRDVAIEANEFAESGQMVSQWFDVNANIQRICVFSEEDIPSVFGDGRYIKYFLQFWDGDDWHEIEPMHGTGMNGIPRYIEINPNVRISNPAFLELQKTGSDGKPVPTTRVRLKVELTRPSELKEYSPMLLSYQLGIKTVS